MAVWDSAKQRMWSRHSHPWWAEVVFALDARLRRRQAVFEYSRDPRCVFRLDINRSLRALVLRDGTRVHPGQRIAQLHFWNEQVPLLPKNGATIAWACQIQQAITTSLVELARFLASRPELSDIAVACADVPSGTRAQSEQLARIMRRYGFETIAEPEHLPFAERMHRFGKYLDLPDRLGEQCRRAARRHAQARAGADLSFASRPEKKFNGMGERRLPCE